MIPKYVATPCTGSEELIRPSGQGDTIDDAVADLLRQSDWIEAHSTFTDFPYHRRSEIQVNVFNGVTPEEAGWDDNENEFDWCIGDTVLESRMIKNPDYKPST